MSSQGVSGYLRSSLDRYEISLEFTIASTFFNFFIFYDIKYSASYIYDGCVQWIHFS